MRFAKGIRERLSDDESGFTLVEVLVVTVLIGILAAIALAALLGEQDKAQDAGAKSDVSALAANLESCFTEGDDFTECDTRAELETRVGVMGLEYDDAITPAQLCDDPDPTDANAPEPGKVAVVAADEKCYVVKATSIAEDGGANHIFILERDLDGDRQRLCRPDSIRNKGACPADGNW